MLNSVAIEYILIALVGGFGAILANKGVAVFNDGLRPIYPQYFDKKLIEKN